MQVSNISEHSIMIDQMLLDKDISNETFVKYTIHLSKLEKKLKDNEFGEDAV
jgi:hypothetical protein